LCCFNIWSSLFEMFCSFYVYSTFGKNNGLRVNLKSLLRINLKISIMSHFFNFFTMGVIVYLSLFEACMIMPKVHIYPSTFNTKKITTILVCWALPPTRDMDYCIKEILETYFILSSFTFEHIFLQQFLLGVFTLWTLLISFILKFKRQQQWWFFLPLSSSSPIATITAVTMVVCGNNEGGEQVVTEVWICRWKNIFCVSLFLSFFQDFFSPFSGDPK
jgi:hypothetical protein